MASAIKEKEKRKHTRRGMWLLGATLEAIKGVKLPSKHEVLCRFLHLHSFEEQTVQSSATVTTKEVLVFWEKARIPTRQEHHIITKIKSLHSAWVSLKKSSSRRTQTQQRNEAAFVETLNDLFDVAHADALTLIKIEEDRDFLLAQREKGRRGCMGPVDNKLAEIEKRRLQRHNLSEARKREEQERSMKMAPSRYTSIESSATGNSGNSSNDNSSAEDAFQGPSCSSTLLPNPKRAKRKGPLNIVNPALAAALDRTKISDRNATFVLSAAARSLGHKPEQLALNRESIRRARRTHRQAIANDLRESFDPDVPLTVHWDGKILPALTSKESVDRLAVLVSGQGVMKLLGVPKMSNSTGESQATEVLSLLELWGVADRVQFMSFDTTASNTGLKSGACVLLQQKMDRDLIGLACRHHILELIVEKVFNQLMGPSSGPDIKLFRRFLVAWKSINKQTYENGLKDAYIALELAPVKADLIGFIRCQIKEFQPRDDYRELLELSLIFLGENPERCTHFLAPGACHRARWMAKLIYCLKIFLFRSQFHLTARETTALRIFNTFVLRFYLKSWYTAPHSSSAPRSDLNLMKELVKYKATNQPVAQVAIKSLLGHLWYLSETLVGLSLFDSSVPVETKQAMVKALDKEGEKHPLPRIQLAENAVPKKQLSDFVTKNTRKLFVALEVSQDFLKQDPSTWEDNVDYISAKKRVSTLKVVNDAAERGVSLMQSFNGALTNQEEQKQFVLQVVEEHRRRFPNANKSTVVKKFEL